MEAEQCCVYLYQSPVASCREQVKQEAGFPNIGESFASLEGAFSLRIIKQSPLMKKRVKLQSLVSLTTATKNAEYAG